MTFTLCNSNAAESTAKSVKSRFPAFMLTNASWLVWVLSSTQRQNRIGRIFFLKALFNICFLNPTFQIQTALCLCQCTFIRKKGIFSIEPLKKNYSALQQGPIKILNKSMLKAQLSLVKLLHFLGFKDASWILIHTSKGCNIKHNKQVRNLMH